MGRLRSYLLLTLVLGVLVGWAAAIDSGRLFDTWGFLHDVQSDSGNTITADTLGAPSNLVVTAPTTGNELDLTFNASNDAYATHYQIFRCTGVACSPTSEISGSPIAEGSLGATCSTPSGACAYNDTGLTGLTTYCYRVVTAYEIGSTLVWTSAATTTVCKQALNPVTLRDLFLTSSANNANTECSSATDSLAASGTGLCKISSTNQTPFASNTWCTAANVTVTAQANWTLTLALDTGNPFQSATLMAQLSLNGTQIASSSTFVILPGGSPATVTMTATGPASQTAGSLCLTITNQTVDSNPNNGAAHDAKILMTGSASKIHGPFDP